MSNDIYTDLARQKPIAPRLGGTYVTLVQAQAGREEVYNRWYEDDHFVTGAMIGPWIFAGRRFMRTQLEAFAGDAAPSELGSFITLYFALDGHVEEAARWIQAMWHSLDEEGRGPQNRTRLYSSMHQLVFDHIFDPAPMAAIHALDFPYRGLAVELIDAPEPDGREELIVWLRDEFVPAWEGAAGQCLGLVPATRDDSRPGILGTRLCLLWLCRDDPHDFWPGPFAVHAEALAASGKGSLAYLASFVPTLPGTRTPLAAASGSA